MLVHTQPDSGGSGLLRGLDTGPQQVAAAAQAVEPGLESLQKLLGLSVDPALSLGIGAVSKGEQQSQGDDRAVGGAAQLLVGGAHAAAQPAGHGKARGAIQLCQVRKGHQHALGAVIAAVVIL